jgi:hypothetical protein
MMDEIYKDEVLKYMDCMDEILNICAFLPKHLGNPDNYEKENVFLTVQIACLQFRRMFELIAISSLVANKDALTGTHDQLLKNHKPDEIFSQIKKLNPDFFPIPAVFDPEINSDKYDYWVRIGNFITEDEIKKGWNLCSNFLHIRNPFKPPLKLNTALDSFKIWLPKIIDLLRIHGIHIKDSFHFVCVMDFTPKRDKIRMYVIGPPKV